MEWTRFISKLKKGDLTQSTSRQDRARRLNPNDFKYACADFENLSTLQCVSSIQALSGSLKRTIFVCVSFQVTGTVPRAYYSIDYFCLLIYLSDNYCIPNLSCGHYIKKVDIQTTVHVLYGLTKYQNQVPRDLLVTYRKFHILCLPFNAFYNS